MHWTDADGDRGETAYDRLVLTVGSVNRLLPIPGVCDHAHGYRGIAEALYLRDHIVRQVELAAAEPADRAARCTFVVVGAGYTGTEVAAQGARFTAQLAKAYPALARPADALDAAGHRAAGAAGAAPEAVAHGRPGAAGAGRRGAHRRVRGRGPRRVGAAHRRRGRADAHARLVRGGAARPARRRPRPQDRPRAARRRPVPGRARPPGDPGLRGRRRGARPHPSRPDHRDDGPARDPAGRAGRAQRGGRARPGQAAPLQAPRPRLRRGARRARRRGQPARRAALRAGRDRRDEGLPPAGDARQPRAGGSPTGCWTPSSRPRPCSSGWCGASRCRWTRSGPRAVTRSRPQARDPGRGRRAAARTRRTRRRGGRR